MPADYQRAIAQREAFAGEIRDSYVERGVADRDRRTTLKSPTSMCASWRSHISTR